MRVLFVENDRLIRVTLAIMLRDRRITVIEAANGLEALQLWSPGTFDALLTDLDMPGMDGAELAIRIREQDNQVATLKSCRLIALTGSSNDSADAGQRLSCFDQVLVKPIGVKLVVDALFRA